MDNFDRLRGRVQLFPEEEHPALRCAFLQHLPGSEQIPQDRRPLPVAGRLQLPIIPEKPQGRLPLTELVAVLEII